MYFWLISNAATRRQAPASPVAGLPTRPRRSTKSSIRRSAPTASRTAAPIRSRKWPSIQSRVKSFGTERTNVSSVSSTAGNVPEPRSVGRVVQRALESPETSVHRLSAVSSCWRATTPGRSPQLRGGAASITVSSQALNEVQPWVKSGVFAGILFRSTPSSTGVDNRQVRHRVRRSRPLAAFFQSCKHPCAVDNAVPRRSSILARRPCKKGARSSFSLTSHREADLSAERTPQEAEARVSSPHVHAGRPRDPEATQSSGP